MNPKTTFKSTSKTEGHSFFQVPLSTSASASSLLTFNSYEGAALMTTANCLQILEARNTFQDPRQAA